MGSSWISYENKCKKTTIIKLSGKTNYKDYKIISFKKDTTYIDTTLTILKEYKYNFLRKDNFELLAFDNQGQTFNNLGYDFTNQNSLPTIGMNAKHFKNMTYSWTTFNTSRSRALWNNELNLNNFTKIIVRWLHV